MNIKLAFTLLTLIAGAAAAQDKTADQLRKAIVEEEASQNLDKAIQAYNEILAQYEEQRHTAAAALFHLADCYRKQGKREQAITAYQRLVRDFSDETKLAEASRNYLTRTFGVRPNWDQASIAEARKQHDLQMVQAETYIKLIQDEIVLVETQIRGVEHKVEAGLASPTGPEMIGLKKELIELRLRLAEAQAGRVPAPATKK